MSSIGRSSRLRPRNAIDYNETPTPLSSSMQKQEKTPVKRGHPSRPTNMTPATKLAQKLDDLNFSSPANNLRRTPRQRPAAPVLTPMNSALPESSKSGKNNKETYLFSDSDTDDTDKENKDPDGNDLKGNGRNTKSPSRSLPVRRGNFKPSPSPARRNPSRSRNLYVDYKVDDNLESENDNDYDYAEEKKVIKPSASPSRLATRSMKGSDVHLEESEREEDEEEYEEEKKQKRGKKFEKAAISRNNDVGKALDDIQIPQSFMHNGEKMVVGQVRVGVKFIKPATLEQPSKLKPLKLKKDGDNKYRVSQNTPKAAAKRPPKRASPSSDESSGESEESEDSESEQGGDSDDIVKRTPARARTSRQQVSPIKKPRTQSAALPRGAQRENETLATIVRRLHTAEVPDKMPCREEEFAKLESFILSCISTNAVSQAMYISGVPGTGKTASVQSVIKKLQTTRSTPSFTYVYVNAMELLDPKQLFVDVYNCVSGNEKRISSIAARRKLNTMFEMVDKKREPIVILIDELDHMCNKKQDLIYDVFNWTTNEKARVSIIAIANTLDLPERLLVQKVSSRLGLGRVVFNPYDHHQIDKIIHDRLKGSKAVSEEAVQLASRKVAALSGDLRKAIDFLRRAAELAIEAKAEQMEMKHVTMAIEESASTIRAGLVCGLSSHMLSMFQAACSQVHSTGVDEFSFYQLFTQYKLICTHGDGVEPLNETVCRRLVSMLGSCRLLNVSSGSNWWRRRIRLLIPLQEAHYLVKNAQQKKQDMEEKMKEKK